MGCIWSLTPSPTRPMLAHQADAAETRSRHTLRSPIELPEPARLGMLAPLSAQLGESHARSRSISRPLLRGAAAHQLAHSCSAPVYTTEMAARWEAAASSEGRSPPSPVSPTSPHRRRGGSSPSSALGRRQDDASTTHQRIRLSPTMITSPPEPKSPSQGTSRLPRANGSNHFDATGLQSHLASPPSHHSSLPEIARPRPRKDRGNHVVADVWPNWGSGATGGLARPAAGLGQAP
jgi:hypothetical protein